MKPQLTNEQRKIAAEIKRLYRREEPLNITAVKRRYPRLMKRVYAVKPFWGWKRALNRAGLIYADIRVELLDFVECELCGHRRASLVTHLWKNHGLAAGEYQADFPGAAILCETLRASTLGRSVHSRKAKLIMPHWEPLWSPEYVLDRTSELHSLGYQVNIQHLNKSDAGLPAMGLRYFGSWDEVICRIGLDPEQTRRKTDMTYWDHARVVREILRRKEQGQGLNFYAVHSGEDRNKTLLGVAYKVFGSWDSALQAAGLNPLETRRAIWNPYPTKTKVLQAIRRRKRRGLPLNYARSRQGTDKDTRLVDSATRLFGSWGAALDAAGISYGNVRRDRSKYFEKSAILKAIRERKRNRLALNAGRVTREDQMLYHWALIRFGSWTEALTAAGLDAKKESGIKRKYPTPASVLAAIRKRKRHGLPLTSQEVHVGQYRDSVLLKWAREYFGSWNKALAEAGVLRH